MTEIRYCEISADVQGEGEAIDTIISIEIGGSDGWGECTPHVFEIARVWYWVIDGCLDKIDESISSQFGDFQEIIHDWADKAWVIAEESGFSIMDEDSDQIRSGIIKKELCSKLQISQMTF